MPRSLSKKEVAAFRDQVCCAAEKIYREKGYAGITMRELATALNVSAMTPYRYFHDKNDIINLLRARAFEKFTSYMQINKINSEQSRNYIEKLIANYLSFEHEYPDLYNMMFLNADDVSYKYLEDSIKTAYASLMSGKMVSIDTDIGAEKTSFITRMLWSVLHGAKCLKEIGVEDSSGEISGAPEVFTKYVLKGCSYTGA